MNVVVQCSGEIISLLVDEIGEVVEVWEKDFESMPETVRLASFTEAARALPAAVTTRLE